jgi:hypothetical protein
MIANLTALNLEVIRGAGRARVRRRLEAMVNDGILGLAGAQMVYRAAFGDRLVAVKQKRGWLARLRGELEVVS